MKKLLLLLVLLAFQVVAFAQQGTVVESLSMKSDLLNRDVKYSIYLPPGYDDSQRDYPVLYLLHGYSDDETGWIQFGEVNRIADEAIDSGSCSPMIIVMPDAKVTWYCNDYQGKDPYEDMFIKEFIPFIESQYRIRSKKEFRAVAGLSMGGYGALMYSMKYNDLFSSCVAFSSGTFTDKEIVNMPDKNYTMFFGDIFGKNLEGQARISKNWIEHSPLHLAKDIPAEKLRSVRYYIDCGDDDFLYKGNSALHVLLRDLKIPHEYRVRDGSHSWTYWRTGLPAGLKFISESFHR
ncbi:alpha/beta hydrolase [Prolixibacter denitrificans]|uniref:Endo-1,4-beta-xylanase n=1 Tax=Prolixibacter denitrificans TaxID=1541063 RepID=A0A2P8CBV6_9BACT|nr:alpha/beta hydrolase family protein [Prolixibacter denitrificans]PSK82444.1 S-formylglutathione hydrolase FrmB [Prolixibacter denitrificans]GET22814.1 endo-1,4-beta-xylanase [Prolixibacter denitrificans]